MRHSNVGPAAHKPSTTPSKPAGVPSPKLPALNAQNSGVVSPTAASSPSSVALGHPVHSAGGHAVVRVFAADVDAFPLAVFEPHSSVHHILATLKLAHGGLKVKGGPDTFLADEGKLAAGDYVVIGSAGLRLRVVWKGNKMVVPYPFPTHQVQQLMEEVASRFTRFHTGETELKMSELRTLDGYLINKYDRIMEAVHDEDQLEAVDFDTWLKEQAQLCKEVWLNLRTTDFVDNTFKWALVGKHSHGKLFVQTGHGKTVDKLELFEIEDLKMFAKEGQQQILTSKGKSDNFEWHASASFSVNTAGQVTAVILEVKSLSDVRPVIKELGINIENGQLVKGAEKTLQTSAVPATENSKPLPPPKKVESLIVDHPVPAEKEPLAKAEGVQKLKIEQVEQVFADQTWAREGVFNNNFYLNFSFTNPGDNSVTIAKVRTEYEVGANNWVAAKETAIGYKAGFYDYRWNWNVSNFSVEKHSVEKVAILCSIPIKGPQVDRLRRAHKSLPFPLKIRTTFEDDQGATSYIEVVHYNAPHELPTKESVEKYNNKTYDFWAQVDDGEAEARHYIAVARIEENEDREYIEVKNSTSSSTNYFYRDDLARFAFEGVKTNSELVEIPALKTSTNGIDVQAWAMVDLANRNTYAIKFVLKSADAYLEDYYRVKPLKYND